MQLEEILFPSKTKTPTDYTIHKGSSSVREKIRTPDLLIRSQTLYPAELRAHIIFYRFFVNAGDRNRTGTGGKSRRILSPVRLPVPPRRHLMGPTGLEPVTLCL